MSTNATVPQLRGVIGFSARLLKESAHYLLAAFQLNKLDCSGNYEYWAEKVFAQGSQSLLFIRANMWFSTHCVSHNHHSHQTNANLSHIDKSTIWPPFPLPDSRRNHKVFLSFYSSIPDKSR